MILSEFDHFTLYGKVTPKQYQLHKPGPTMEMIGLENLLFNGSQAIDLALKENHFLEFRVDPRFRKNENFPPRLSGEQRTLAHFYQVPAGYELKNMPKILADRVLREPLDIREVIAVGKTLEGERHEYAIFAPSITGEARKLIKILRHPGWQGLGLMISVFDPDEDKLWEMNFIGFSTP
jgi:hypothetical protein